MSTTTTHPTRWQCLRFAKALQAAAAFLRLAGGRMPYLKLLKLLYIADRECLAEEGDTITGDRVCAMPRGPVLSTVLRLIKRNDSQWEHWHCHIKCGEDFTVVLADDPGTPDLYRFEKAIIERVFREHGHKRSSELVAWTHEFPEWKKYAARLRGTQKRSYVISLEEMLEGIGKPELIDQARDNRHREAYYNRIRHLNHNNHTKEIHCACR